MDVADEIRAYQRKEYLSKFIQNDVRPDNRALGETRPAMMSLGAITSADGSAMVKLGNTVVVCGIKCEIIRPPADKQNCGVIIANVQLPPMCSPEFKTGPPSEQAQVLSDYVQQIINDTHIVDHTQLCIEEGEKCWLLHCDVLCCNYDGLRSQIGLTQVRSSGPGWVLLCVYSSGNIRDAVLLAMVGALKNLTLPTSSYDRDEEKLIIDTETRHKVELHCVPVPLSFTLFEDDILLVDPTHEEESVSAGHVTIITTGGDNISHINKQGGASLNMEQLSQCIKKAKHRWTDICELLDKSK